MLLFGLVAARLTHSDHPPDVADAFLTMAFLVVVVAALAVDRPVALRAPFGVVALLGGLLLATVPGSLHPWLSLLSVPEALCALAALLAVTAIGQSARTPALLGLLFGAALSSVTAIVQRFVTWPDALSRREELGLTKAHVDRLVEGRPLGLTLSPDLMSALALCGIVAALALSSSKNALVKRGALLLSVPCLVGLALSRSAGGALAAGLFFAVWALIVVLRGLRGPAALVVLVVALALPVSLVALLGRGMEQLGRSAQERLLNWQVGLDVLERHLLSGVGFGRFSTAYLSARPPEGNVTRYAHSFPVQTLVEGGLLFGGVSLIVIVIVVLSLLRARLTGTPDRSRDVVLAGVLALFARATYDYDLQIGATATALAVLVGVAILDARREGFVLSESVVPTTARRRTALASFTLGGLLVVAVTAAGAGLYREAALTPFTRGHQPTQEDLARLRAYGDRFPADPHVATVEARILLSALERCADDCASLEQEARELIEEEREHAPPELFVLTGVLARRGGDRQGAERALTRALEEDPGYPPAHRLRIAWAQEDDDERLARYEHDARRWRVSERER